MQSIPEYLTAAHGITLSAQQQEAVLAEKRHTLLLAVPGSGKTTVLVSRIAHLICRESVSPEQMLTLTFSRESARDMKQRFDVLFAGLIHNPPRFSTIHSFCYSVLRYYAQRYGRKLPELIGDRAAPVLRSIYSSLNDEYLSDDLLEGLMNDLGLVKNLMLSREDLLEFEVTTDHFYEIYEQYQQVKREHDWMDYDDMLAYTLDILKKVAGVREYVSGKYQYLNIDEAQDTSRIQYEIVRLMSDSMTLFVVGDEDQSIYTFRGAYPEGLTKFQDTYPDAQILKIEQNYRSVPDIVTRANLFIQQNKNRHPKEMTASSRSGQAAVETVKLPDYSAQYGHLVDSLSKEEGSIGVLYRNNESAVPVIDALYRAGIPFYIKEHNLRFFTSFVVKDITAFLMLATDPMDITAFEQIYYKWHCSKAVFFAVRDSMEGSRSVIDAVLGCPDAPFYLKKKLREYEGHLKQIAGKHPAQAIDMIVSRLGYGEYLEKKHATGSILRLNILRTLARPYRKVPEYLDALLSLKQRIGSREGISQKAAVTLSSVHSSKGLEFDRVYLLDMIEGILPGEEAAEDASSGDYSLMEDEARLFYVAVTRARARLTLYTSRYCNDELVTVSRFVTRFLGRQDKKVKPRRTERVDWLAGKTVRHKFFGTGLVIETGPEDTIQISFDRHGVRELSYDACKQNNILTVL